MKRSTFAIVLALTALLLVSLFRSNAWAAGLVPEPPFGVAIQSQAAGPKLSGVVFMELLDLDSETLSAAAGRTCVRFRQGADLNMFCGLVPGPLPIDNIDAIVNALKDSDLMERAVSFFSPGDEVVATKNFEELTFIGAGGDLQRIAACVKKKKNVIAVVDSPLFAMVDITFTLGTLD